MKPLGPFVSDLVARINMLEEWRLNGRPNVFWMSGFYFPQAFITGAMQNYARKHKVPIDQLGFDFEVVDTPWEEITAAPDDGVYVRGLFLEGARWDYEKKVLTDSRPKELYTAMPVIWIKPTKLVDIVVKPGHYKCPLYKILSRQGTLSTTGHSTNFIMPMTIPGPADLDPSHWTKRGTALFTTLNY